LDCKHCQSGDKRFVPGAGDRKQANGDRREWIYLKSLASKARIGFTGASEFEGLLLSEDEASFSTFFVTF